MSSEAQSKADLAAAAAAFRSFAVELWTLFSVGAAFTVLRTYARIKAVGIKQLRPDDYFVWLGIVFFATQAALAYNVTAMAGGIANNGMTAAERAALSLESEEHAIRSDPETQRFGSCAQIQVAGWTIYSALIWSLKLSVLFFYLRLTEGLSRRYRVRVYVGFVLIIGTFMSSILTIFLGCRPLHKYWQISPDPGNSCQAAVSLPIIWSSFAANVSTDIYLLLIPLPLLWESSLRLVKKIASTIVLGAGIVVLICATLKSVYVLVDPINGAQLAGAWGVREAFTAVITTNLPMIFPLLKTWLQPWLGTMLGSSRKAYRTPSGFRTIGEGGPSKDGRSRRGPPSANPITANMTFSESEERIVADIKMQKIGAGFNKLPANGILVSKEMKVTAEDGSMNETPPQRFGEAW
ncbi:hypothetical protein B0T11DRAFT_293106 [Plectosphaerella cucumerina]|uniref:Rhodopsin domain-containing protein n=1 Tax=Plectosphaerella cucumerina TaxID=40658 RepID=A0A8K0TV11_9PEZI|nr:hypothetical protein B0T11DRAFT_293106 [Plectosphaerella cucumerina]